MNLRSSTAIQKRRPPEAPTWSWLSKRQGLFYQHTALIDVLRDRQIYPTSVRFLQRNGSAIECDKFFQMSASPSISREETVRQLRLEGPVIKFEMSRPGSRYEGFNYWFVNIMAPGLEQLGLENKVTARYYCDDKVNIGQLVDYIGTKSRRWTRPHVAIILRVPFNASADEVQALAVERLGNTWRRTGVVVVPLGASRTRDDDFQKLRQREISSWVQTLPKMSMVID